MTTYEIEFHKVSSLPSNNENYRGHVFFNDATNEPIVETTTDEEGNVIKKRQHEKGIYLCAYDEKGKLSYIPYTVNSTRGDNVGIDINTLNDRITLWASKFQNDIQKLAKLTVDPDQIMIQVKKFYNELNGEVADLRIKSGQITEEVAKYVEGVKNQYSQFTQTANGIATRVDSLAEGYTTIKQTAKDITSRVDNLESDWSRVEQTATGFEKTVRDDINNLESRVSQTASSVSSVVEGLKDVKSQIKQFPDQIKMEVSNGLNSASILETINNDESEIKIKADKIQLGGIIIHDNDIASSNGKFSVTDKGVLTAKSGSIGGIEIHDNNIASSNGNFSITDKGVLTATNANITGAITATSLEIGSGVTIPQSSIHGLESTLSNIQTTATNAVSTASNALTGISGLQNNLNSLQNQVSEYLNGSSGSSPNWITNAFSQTIAKDGLLLSGNIFVAGNDGLITAGMMGATATNADTTPRFFAGNPNNSITSSDADLNPDNIYGTTDNTDNSTPNYPFMVTADGHLYATNADLTGSLKIQRTVKNDKGEDVVKSFDIGDYVIGKMKDGVLDTKDTVTGAIGAINNEVYGPVWDENATKEYNNYNIMSSKSLFGKILRIEAQISALQRDIDALASQNDSSSSENITFDCFLCGTETKRAATANVKAGEAVDDADKTKTYGNVDKIKCSNPDCGAIAYRRRFMVADSGTGGGTGPGGGTGSGSGLITDIEIKPRPDLPITSPKDFE